MASTSDFKNGLVLNLEGQLWTITEFQHVKPGKGPAFELLPGCHLVAVESDAAGKPPSVIFAFEMRPGYIYTIAPGAEIAQERAPDGSVVPLRRAAAPDVTACRSWAKAQRY